MALFKSRHEIVSRAFIEPPRQHVISSRFPILQTPTSYNFFSLFFLYNEVKHYLMERVLRWGDGQNAGD
ncbi:hypothetical protein HanXRQr2_Chr17g0809301 [Helianthus annuus]|uniref:Uncharacterized protein n=1 Tax=Helianthus annuus TaxID=4232 RepID=A0A9K3DKS6_HELAN|nr:hypothetical protein HanXRQr2_Chr17g0809301 [Helianthus annuus]